MSSDSVTILVILGVTMALFIWNRLRYDVVAGIALMAAVYTGLVPMDAAFEGFSHPAVITVAAVLVISQALQTSGVTELLLAFLSRARGSRTGQLAANSGLTLALSAVMNNIGALALMLPVTLRDAARAARPPSALLMPLSFASLLGGLITAIGTPPNIIIATFRDEHVGEPFGMFDFTPVGLSVALGGLLFLILASHRLLPAPDDVTTARELSADQRVSRYLTEVRIPGSSPLVGTSIGSLEWRCENEVTVMAILRRQRRRLAPSAQELVQADDVLILEGDSEALQPLLIDPKLVEAGAEQIDPALLSSPDVRVVEAVVMPNSVLQGVSARELGMHRRFGVNLLAIAREGQAARVRLKLVHFRLGDVLLLQGDNDQLEQACSSLGCLAIKDRGLDIKRRRGALMVPTIFALGILAAAFDLVPIQIAFTTVVGLLVVLRMVSLRDAYRSIEWPVIVLLGMLIPVGEALQTTGTTTHIAEALSGIAGDLPVWGVVALLIVVSMLLADLIHNTPTAVLMAPVALGLANSLGQPPDAFLMAVAIGAASPYLTPIGHQSNTLVMGPGGYRFGDYWRLGLPLDFVICAIATPAIMLVWF